MIVIMKAVSVLFRIGPSRDPERRSDETERAASAKKGIWFDRVQDGTITGPSSNQTLIKTQRVFL